MQLMETPEFTWHRLVTNPDAKNPDTGPTAFFASWHLCVVSGVRRVSTKDHLNGGCHSYRVSGTKRVRKYLTTPVCN